VCGVRVDDIEGGAERAVEFIKTMFVEQQAYSRTSPPRKCGEWTLP
jgi:hypothetical protein